MFLAIYPREVHNYFLIQTTPVYSWPRQLLEDEINRHLPTTRWAKEPQ